MRGKLFIEESEKAGVFASEDAVSPEFLPDSFPGRESELRQLAEELKPALSGRQPRALFLHGPPGTGKTSCVKFVFREMKEYSSAVECVYVNCWSNYTKQSVLAELSQAMQQPLPRRGLASDEVFSRVLQAAKADGKTVVVALDEVDRLFHSGGADLLYELARAKESHGVCFGIVAMTNDKSVFAKLDDRSRSSLRQLELEFARYSPQDLKLILRERSDAAFRKNACSDEAIALSAAHAAKNGGDARIGIQTLWEAGKNADKRGSGRVEEQDARKVIESRKASASQEKRLEGLSETEEKIIAFLKDGGKESGEIYEALKKQSGLTDRSIRNYLSLLENKRVVSSETLANAEGKPGLTRKFKLAF